MKFLYFSSFGGKVLPARIRIPDPDSLTQLNPDPIRNTAYLSSYCESGTFSGICIQQTTVTVLLVITFLNIKPYPDDLEGLQIFRQSQPKTQYGQVGKTD